MTLPDPTQAFPTNQKPPPRKKKRTVNLTQEIPENERTNVTELPEPESYGAVLVALSRLDPLAQEVMIAQRISIMPSQKDGTIPVNIPRMVRGPWAHHLRKLGIFCIPELATHELVSSGDTGIMANHSPMKMRQLTPEDLWDVAKAQNPELANLIDNAKTPEDKQKAMRTLSAKLPVEQRIAMEKLSALMNDDHPST